MNEQKIDERKIDLKKEGEEKFKKKWSKKMVKWSEKMIKKKMSQQWMKKTIQNKKKVKEIIKAVHLIEEAKNNPRRLFPNFKFECKPWRLTSEKRKKQLTAISQQQQKKT